MLATGDFGNLCRSATLETQQIDNSLNILDVIETIFGILDFRRKPEILFNSEQLKQMIFVVRVFVNSIGGIGQPELNRLSEELGLKREGLTFLRNCAHLQILPIGTFQIDVARDAIFQFSG